MIPEILALVPARGGSKSVPHKNIKLLCGKPLIAYTIEEAKKSKFISRIIVSTDTEKIADTARKFGAEAPFLRPAKLAGDHVQDFPVFLHALNWLKKYEGYVPKVVVHLRPTAPLRKAKHIDAGVQILFKNPQADSVRSVYPAPKHPLKMWKILNDYLCPFVPENIYGIKEAYNYPRQKLPKAYIQNGSVDVIWTDTIVKKKSMSGERILSFVMDEIDSVSIDTPVEFALAEILLKTK